MTAKQALAEAVRRWGKAAAVQDRGKKSATTPETRAAAKAELIELNKTRKELHVEPPLFDSQAYPDDTPLGTYRAVVQSHRAAARKARERKDWLMGIAYSSRFYVGVATWAFEIRGSGDTWEEAFAAADKKGK